jgi:hypothetical protein
MTRLIVLLTLLIAMQLLWGCAHAPQHAPVPAPDNTIIPHPLYPTDNNAKEPRIYQWKQFNPDATRRCKPNTQGEVDG